MQRDLIVIALIASTLGLVIAAPAFALQQSLTGNEKGEIMDRCLNAGGSVRTCCAAAGGVWKSDGKGGGGCSLTADKSGRSPSNIRSPIKPSFSQ